MADEMLSDARAVSAGLRQLGKSLGEQAETILREVQAGQRKMRSELRAAAGSPRGADEEPPLTPRGGRRSSAIDDLDVPTWAEPNRGS
jgi:hypothetical protein